MHDVHVEGCRAELDVDPEHLDELLAYLTRVGVRSLISQPPTLEALFLRHYSDGGEDLQEVSAAHAQSAAARGRS